MGNHNSSKNIKHNENIKYSYFNTIKKLRRQFYLKNEKSKDNISISFENKTFDTIIDEESLIFNSENNLNKEYIHWMDYFYDYLYSLKEKKIEWANNLIDILEDEFFLSENKYLSLFFFEEFKIKTEPNCIKTLYIKNQIEKNNRISFSELNITKNLGGSFESIDTNLLLPNDPAIEYKNSRSKVKEYISLFKEHVEKEDHPINIISRKFSKVFSREVKNTIDHLNNISYYNNDNLNSIISKETNELTYQLQTFIIKMQIVLKLMYCKCIDYSCFKDEKDELINIITSLVFKVGNIYQVMYNLHSLNLKSSLQNLEYKFEILKEIKPEDLGIEKQLCLNSLTLEYQIKLIKKLINNELNEKEFSKNINLKAINKEKLEKIKESLEKKSKNIPLILKSFISKENDSSKLEYFFTEIEDEEINDLGSLLPEDNIETSKEKEEIRQRINSRHNFINPQKYKITKLKDQKPKDVIYSPYTSCISIIKSLKKYKSPFEKIMIIASLSDEIEDCVHEFWEELNEFIDKNVLMIEASQLMNIFIYIIIKAKMSDIIVYCKIISLFTTCTTKSSMIGYYYSTFEASISYILQIKNVKEILVNKKDIDEEI